MLGASFSLRKADSLAPNWLCPYKTSVGQQHRVRAKRKRRNAYLKRKKAATKSMRREASKAKSRKQPAPAD